MATEKRLIDLGDALRMVKNSREDCPETSIYGRAIWDIAHKCALSCLTSCDAVDAVEVVRCKDCKHYMTIHCTCDGCCISDDWYCADGERRTDNG